MNDAWEKTANGECEPKSEHMQLNCNADGITVELAKVLIPDATSVFLPGDCSGTFDDESKGSTIYTVIQKSTNGLSNLKLKISLNF